MPLLSSSSIPWSSWIFLTFLLPPFLSPQFYYVGLSKLNTSFLSPPPHLCLVLFHLSHISASRPSILPSHIPFILPELFLFASSLVRFSSPSPATSSHVCLSFILPIDLSPLLHTSVVCIVYPLVLFLIPYIPVLSIPLSSLIFIFSPVEYFLSTSSASSLPGSLSSLTFLLYHFTFPPLFFLSARRYPFHFPSSSFSHPCVITFYSPLSPFSDSYVILSHYILLSFSHLCFPTFHSRLCPSSHLYPFHFSPFSIPHILALSPSFICSYISPITIFSSHSPISASSPSILVSTLSHILTHFTSLPSLSVTFLPYTLLLPAVIFLSFLPHAVPLPSLLFPTSSSLFVLISLSLRHPLQLVSYSLHFCSILLSAFLYSNADFIPSLSLHCTSSQWSLPSSSSSSSSSPEPQ